MISVQEALDLILGQSLASETEEVGLLDAMDRILAEPIKADRDAPPFNRVTMDGIALHSTAISSDASFRIESIQAAGQPPTVLNKKENCIEVMTGAILPGNTDCVIPYEQIKLSGGVAFLDSSEHHPFQNVHMKGSDAKKGETLLNPGQRITPAHIGVLASVGISSIRVQKMPEIAICSTGDELVDVDQEPEVHQIRKSNANMLNATLIQLGIRPKVFHLRDDKAAMMRELTPLVGHFQVILFSGAVSKGKYDFLPQVLQELGMKKILHGVAQRPGKPFLFGTFPRSVVFGFPGNPASTYVCFHTYFRPWLQKHLKLPIQKYTAVLQGDIQFNQQMTYHLLVVLRLKEGVLTASPIGSSGSGDLVHLAQANGVLSLPPEKNAFFSGEIYPFIPFGRSLF